MVRSFGACCRGLFSAKTSKKQNQDLSALCRPCIGSCCYSNYDYLDPKSMQNNSPKHLKLAQRAIILHTFGVQVLLLSSLLSLLLFGVKLELCTSRSRGGALVRFDRREAAG